MLRHKRPEEIKTSLTGRLASTTAGASFSRWTKDGIFQRPTSTAGCEDASDLFSEISRTTRSASLAQELREARRAKVAAAAVRPDKQRLRAQAAEAAAEKAAALQAARQEAEPGPEASDASFHRASGHAEDEHTQRDSAHAVGSTRLAFRAWGNRRGFSGVHHSSTGLSEEDSKEEADEAEDTKADPASSFGSSSSSSALSSTSCQTIEDLLQRSARVVQTWAKSGRKGGPKRELETKMRYCVGLRGEKDGDSDSIPIPPPVPMAIEANTVTLPAPDDGMTILEAAETLVGSNVHVDTIAEILKRFDAVQRIRDRTSSVLGEAGESHERQPDLRPVITKEFMNTCALYGDMNDKLHETQKQMSEWEVTCEDQDDIPSDDDQPALSPFRMRTQEWLKSGPLKLYGESRTRYNKFEKRLRTILDLISKLQRNDDADLEFQKFLKSTIQNDGEVYKLLDTLLEGEDQLLRMLTLAKYTAEDSLLTHVTNANEVVLPFYEQAADCWEQWLERASYEYEVDRKLAIKEAVEAVEFAQETKSPTSHHRERLYELEQTPAEPADIAKEREKLRFLRSKLGTSKDEEGRLNRIIHSNRAIKTTVSAAMYAKESKRAESLITGKASTRLSDQMKKVVDMSKRVKKFGFMQGSNIKREDNLHSAGPTSPSSLSSRATIALPSLPEPLPSALRGTVMPSLQREETKKSLAELSDSSGSKRAEELIQKSLKLARDNVFRITQMKEYQLELTDDIRKLLLFEAKAAAERERGGNGNAEELMRLHASRELEAAFWERQRKDLWKRLNGFTVEVSSIDLHTGLQLERPKRRGALNAKRHTGLRAYFKDEEDKKPKTKTEKWAEKWEDAAPEWVFTQLALELRSITVEDDYLRTLTGIQYIAEYVNNQYGVEAWTLTTENEPWNIWFNRNPRQPFLPTLTNGLELMVKKGFADPLGRTGKDTLVNMQDELRYLVRDFAKERSERAACCANGKVFDEQAWEDRTTLPLDDLVERLADVYLQVEEINAERQRRLAGPEPTSRKTQKLEITVGPVTQDETQDSRFARFEQSVEKAKLQGKNLRLMAKAGQIKHDVGKRAMIASSLAPKTMQLEEEYTSLFQLIQGYPELQACKSSSLQARSAAEDIIFRISKADEEAWVFQQQTDTPTGHWYKHRDNKLNGGQGLEAGLPGGPGVGLPPLPGGHGAGHFTASLPSLRGGFGGSAANAVGGSQSTMPTYTKRVFTLEPAFDPGKTRMEEVIQTLSAKGDNSEARIRSKLNLARHQNEVLEKRAQRKRQEFQHKVKTKAAKSGNTKVIEEAQDANVEAKYEQWTKEMNSWRDAVATNMRVEHFWLARFAIWHEETRVHYGDEVVELLKGERGPEWNTDMMEALAVSLSKAHERLKEKKALAVAEIRRVALQSKEKNSAVAGAFLQMDGIQVQDDNEQGRDSVLIPLGVRRRTHRRASKDPFGFEDAFREEDPQSAAEKKESRFSMHVTSLTRASVGEPLQSDMFMLNAPPKKRQGRQESRRRIIGVGHLKHEARRRKSGAPSGRQLSQKLKPEEEYLAHINRIRKLAKLRMKTKKFSYFSEDQEGEDEAVHNHRLRMLQLFQEDENAADAASTPHRGISKALSEATDRRSSSSLSKESTATASGQKDFVFHGSKHLLAFLGEAQTKRAPTNARRQSRALLWGAVREGVSAAPSQGRRKSYVAAIAAITSDYLGSKQSNRAPKLLQVLRKRLRKEFGTLDKAFTAATGKSGKVMTRATFIKLASSMDCAEKDISYMCSHIALKLFGASQEADFALEENLFVELLRNSGPVGSLARLRARLVMQYGSPKLAFNAASSGESTLSRTPFDEFLGTVGVDASESQRLFAKIARQNERVRAAGDEAAVSRRAFLLCLDNAEGFRAGHRLFKHAGVMVARHGAMPPRAASLDEDEGNLFVIGRNERLRGAGVYDEVRAYKTFMNSLDPNDISRDLKIDELAAVLEPYGLTCYEANALFRLTDRRHQYRAVRLHDVAICAFGGLGFLGRRLAYHVREVKDRHSRTRAGAYVSEAVAYSRSIRLEKRQRRKLAKGEMSKAEAELAFGTLQHDQGITGKGVVSPVPLTSSDSRTSLASTGSAAPSRLSSKGIARALIEDDGSQMPIIVDGIQEEAIAEDSDAEAVAANNGEEQKADDFVHIGARRSSPSLSKRSSSPQPVPEKPKEASPRFSVAVAGTKEASPRFSVAASPRFSVAVAGTKEASPRFSVVSARTSSKEATTRASIAQPSSSARASSKDTSERKSLKDTERKSLKDASDRKPMAANALAKAIRQTLGPMKDDGLGDGMLKVTSQALRSKRMSAEMKWQEDDIAPTMGSLADENEATLEDIVYSPSSPEAEERMHACEHFQQRQLQKRLALLENDAMSLQIAVPKLQEARMHILTRFRSWRKAFEKIAGGPAETATISLKALSAYLASSFSLNPLDAIRLHEVIATIEVEPEFGYAAFLRIFRFAAPVPSLLDFRKMLVQRFMCLDSGLRVLGLHDHQRGLGLDIGQFAQSMLAAGIPGDDARSLFSVVDAVQPGGKSGYVDMSSFRYVLDNAHILGWLEVFHARLTAQGGELDLGSQQDEVLSTSDGLDKALSSFGFPAELAVPTYAFISEHAAGKHVTLNTLAQLLRNAFGSGSSRKHAAGRKPPNLFRSKGLKAVQHFAASLGSRGDTGDRLSMRPPADRNSVMRPAADRNSVMAHAMRPLSSGSPSEEVQEDALVQTRHLRRNITAHYSNYEQVFNVLNKHHRKGIGHDEWMESMDTFGFTDAMRWELIFGYIVEWQHPRWDTRVKQPQGVTLARLSTVLENAVRCVTLPALRARLLEKCGTMPRAWAFIAGQEAADSVAIGQAQIALRRLGLPAEDRDQLWAQLHAMPEVERRIDHSTLRRAAFQRAMRGVDAFAPLLDLTKRLSQSFGKPGARAPISRAFEGCDYSRDALALDAFGKEASRILQLSGSDARPLFSVLDAHQDGLVTIDDLIDALTHFQATYLAHPARSSEVVHDPQQQSADLPNTPSDDDVFLETEGAATSRTLILGSADDAHASVVHAATPVLHGSRRLRQSPVRSTTADSRESPSVGSTATPSSLSMRSSSTTPLDPSKWDFLRRKGADTSQSGFDIALASTALPDTSSDSDHGQAESLPPRPWTSMSGSGPAGALRRHGPSGAKGFGSKRFRDVAGAARSSSAMGVATGVIQSPMQVDAPAAPEVLDPTALKERPSATSVQPSLQEPSARATSGSQGVPHTAVDTVLMGMQKRRLAEMRGGPDAAVENTLMGMQNRRQRENATAPAQGSRKESIAQAVRSSMMGEATSAASSRAPPKADIPEETSAHRSYTPQAPRSTLRRTSGNQQQQRGATNNPRHGSMLPSLGPGANAAPGSRIVEAAGLGGVQGKRATVDPHGLPTNLAIGNNRL